MKKRQLLQIYIIGILIAFSFFAGALAYKYDLHQKVLSIFKKEIITAQYPSPVYYNNTPLFELKNLSYPFTFIVYGDSQEEAGPEKDYIIDKVIEENPNFIIKVGDSVIRGNSHQWKIFDLCEGEILRKNIPFYPTLGNHEYSTLGEDDFSDPTEQLNYYFDRFKFLDNRRWYSFTYGNSLFLILDSNTNYSEGSIQYNWLIDKLNNTYSKFMFISLHHPPHTKSTAHPIRNEEKKLADLLESYSSTRLVKPDIIFSGHCHNYERYVSNNITYIVTGGGGAPQYKVIRDSDDFYNESGDTYHYTKITVFEDRLDFEMIKLVNSTNWEVKDSFSISK